MSRRRTFFGSLARCAVVVAAVVAICCLASAASACPTCKEDLANDPQGRDLATGFYYSILLMMSMPFAIIGMLGFVAYRSVKRAQLANGTKTTPDVKL